MREPDAHRVRIVVDGWRDRLPPWVGGASLLRSEADGVRRSLREAYFFVSLGFGANREHQPSGLILPSTSLQLSGGTNCRQIEHF